MPLPSAWCQGLILCFDCANMCTLLYPIVYAHGHRQCSIWVPHGVQPLLTHNAAWPLCVSTICIVPICCSHTGSWALLALISWAVIPNTVESHTVSQDSRLHCKVQMNEWPLIQWRFNCISTKEWNETRPSHLCLKSTNEDFSVGFWDMKWFI